MTIAIATNAGNPNSDALMDYGRDGLHDIYERKFMMLHNHADSVFGGANDG